MSRPVVVAGSVVKLGVVVGAIEFRDVVVAGITADVTEKMQQYTNNAWNQRHRSRNVIM
jgi:hypothetical protein